MGKVPFKITAEAQTPTKALIRMIGEIGWDVDSESFRREVDVLVGAGITDVHIYMHGPGGSCFDASEIVNILSAFTGEVTGEGGALVASAYTYIAMHCKTFTMPENGMFMVHKPSGRAYGTANQILSYHGLISGLESGYYEKYKAVAKNIAEFDSKWDAGDYWMTAKEAVEAGFVTSVKEATQINKSTAMMIAACGYPLETSLLINTNENEMDVKSMAAALGLPDTATEKEVLARIDKNKRNSEKLETVEKEVQAKAKKELADKVKAKLDKAISEKRISANAREQWSEKLESDFEGVSAMLDSIAPAVSLLGQIKTEVVGGKVTANGKTFEELQEEGVEVLAQLQDSDPEAYDSLFTDYKKRNNI